MHIRFVRLLQTGDVTAYILGNGAVMHLKQIFIHPIASARPQALNSVSVTAAGLAGDRAWTVFSVEDGIETLFNQLVKGGEQLATVAAVLSEDGDRLTCSAPGRPDLVIQTAAHDSDRSAAWFTDVLGRPVRLRPTWPDRRDYQNMDDAGLHDADRLPLHVTGQASLDALRPHFTDPSIDMSRYRPNLVLSANDAPPFVEDVIGDFRIGTAIMRMVMPQARCKITTVDQLSGDVSDQREPLKTLAKQRLGKADAVQGVFFGQRAIVIEPGRIAQGDAVEVLNWREPHPAIRNVKLGYAGPIPATPG